MGEAIRFVSDVVPFRESGGRRYLTLEQLRNDPELYDFVKRFSANFEKDTDLSVWWLREPDISQGPSL